MKIKIGRKLLWCNETALEIERIIETQDVIHWNNFYEHWNKRHADFEQSSTDKLSPGNGVVRSPGNEIITFALGLDCASSKKMWVNKLYDYKDGRLREWKKCFLIVLFSLARKKIFMMRIFDIGRIFGKSESGRLLLKSGASRSNQEGWNVWNCFQNFEKIVYYDSNNLIKWF